MKARFARVGFMLAVIGSLVMLVPAGRASAGTSRSDIPSEVNTVDETQPSYHHNPN